MEDDFIIINTSFEDSPYVVGYNVYTSNIHRAYTNTYDMCIKSCDFLMNRPRSKMKGQLKVVNKRMMLRNEKVINLKNKINGN